MENENSIWTNLYPPCSFVSVKQTINCGRSFRSEVLRAHKRSIESCSVPQFNHWCDNVLSGVLLQMLVIRNETFSAALIPEVFSIRFLHRDVNKGNFLIKSLSHAANQQILKWITLQMLNQSKNTTLQDCILKGILHPKITIWSFITYPPCRSEPIKASFVFITQLKIFWIKNCPIVCQINYTVKVQKIMKSIARILHLLSVVLL